MNEQRETYTEYCKDFIIDKLPDYEGQTVCGCDLAYKLTEEINVDGSATYSTYEAKEYIKEWWDEAGEYYEYSKREFDECPQNPFENPEAFHVCMIIEGVIYLLAQCPTVDGQWNDEFELTDETIKQILSELKEVGDIEF